MAANWSALEFGCLPDVAEHLLHRPSLGIFLVRGAGLAGERADTRGNKVIAGGRASYEDSGKIGCFAGFFTACGVR